MRYCARAVLYVCLTLLCAGFSRAAAQQSVAPMHPAGVREGFVDAGGGVHLFYRIAGSGRDTVVVLHGGPGFSMSYLAADLEPLAARHVVLFYDQRGAGRSTAVSDSSALDGQRFADDLEAVRRHFALERLTLLGHSWGAGVAALYAARHPDRVGRLIVVDGIPATRAEVTRAFQVLESRRDSATQRRVLELRAIRDANPESATACRAYYNVALVAYFGDSGVAHRSRGDFCAGTPKALRNKILNVDRFTESSLGDWDWRPALHAVTAPALVIHGTLDFISTESSREWAAALPNSRLLLLDGSGHFPYVEVPERFFAAVDSFLQGNWPPGSEPVASRAIRPTR